MQKITVFGAGYVGLVTGVCLAEIGHDVMCMDVDPHKIAMLKDAKVPFYEPDLESLLNKNIVQGRLHFTNDVAVAVHHGTFLMIAVGTPSASDGTADLQYVQTVSENIGTHFTQDATIIIKSTVPVGTGEKVTNWIASTLPSNRKHLNWSVVSNPEFLREGTAVKDFMVPDRIVVGIETETALHQMKTLYKKFIDEGHSFISMNRRSSEFSKYVANGMLATKISFINEMSQIAERVHADIDKVKQAISLDHRIGPSFINPGCGYGGSCFPKDVSALIATAQAVDYQPALMQAVSVVNEQQKSHLFTKIMHYFRGDLRGRTFALWGLAFKPNTDDVREAPSQTLLSQLWQAGCRVQAYDPVASDVIKRLYGDRADLILTTDPESALINADGLMIVTEWNVFREFSLAKISSLLKKPVIFDGRNLYAPEQVAAAGLEYFSIGRG